MNWQPIETAPQDGTRVLLWDCRDAFRRGVSAVVGLYSTGGYTEGWEDDRGAWLSPTHWVPLPEPPK